MLERATKCLQHGGKNAIVSQGKDRHTGRSLQSLFWSHGAGDISLPSWWSEFLYQPDFRQPRTTKSSRLPPRTVRSDFLDFLYPPKTFEFAQNLTARDVRKYRASRQRLPSSGGGRHNHRKVSSRSQVAAAAAIDQELDELLTESVLEEVKDVHEIQSNEAVQDLRSVSQEPSLQNQSSGIEQGNATLQEEEQVTAAEDLGMRALMNDDSNHTDQGQMLEQSENLEISRTKVIAKLDELDQAATEVTSRLLRTDEHEDLSVPLLTDLIHEASSILDSTDVSTDVDEAKVRFWRRQSMKLAEAYTSYLDAFKIASSIPQAKDNFYSTFSYEVPLIQQQFESTQQAGLTFLTLFMDHLYTSVLPRDQALWSNEQWSFLVKRTLLYPQQGVAITRDIVSIDNHIPSGISGVFELLKQANSVGKADVLVREVLKLAMNRGQISVIVGLIQFCDDYGLEKILAYIDTIDSPTLARNILLLIERIQVIPQLRKRVDIDRRIQPQRAAYLDVINQLTMHLLQRPLSPEVNVAAYEQAWKILLKYGYLETKDFVLLLNQLIDVHSADNEDISAFVHFAYKIFVKACQRTDFVWAKEQVHEFLRKMIRVHHPYCIRVFKYYHDVFGYDSETHKNMLPELSNAGEAEQWQEVYGVIESKEKLNKSEWFHQLLIAYSKRGDTATCRALLESALQDERLQLDLRSWNAVLHSYVQCDDMKGALEFHQHMKQQGIKLDASTAMVLLHGYSSRGETVQALEQAARIGAEGYELTSKTIEALIHSHLVNDDMNSAEQLLYDTNSVDAKESNVGAWNMVLRTYAYKGKIVDMNYLHGLMRQYGIKENASTYGAFMLGFCMANLPSMAFRIMSKIMPTRNMVPTVEHYNTLMSGLVRRREYEFALQVYRLAKKEHIKPDAKTRSLAIQAIASTCKGIKKGDADWDRVYPQAVANAERFLQQSLKEDSHQYSISPGMTGTGRLPLNKAYADLHFAFLIRQYAMLRDKKKVSELLQQYRNFYTEGSPDERVMDEPPNVLTAIGKLYLTEKNTEGILTLWERALNSLTPIVASTGAIVGKPGWVSRSRSMTLSPVFRIRMIDLMRRKQHFELQNLIESLVVEGWRFPDIIWNLYVRFLAMEGYTEMAFKYCEQYLIDGFPGWPKNMEYGVSPYRTLNKRGVGSTGSRVMKPTYETLCWLAKSYMDFRKMHAFSIQRTEHMARLYAIAPKSLNAITYMPKVNDATQDWVLRRGGKATNMEHGLDTTQTV